MDIITVQLSQGFREKYSIPWFDGDVLWAMLEDDEWPFYWGA